MGTKSFHRIFGRIILFFAARRIMDLNLSLCFLSLLIVSFSFFSSKDFSFSSFILIISLNTFKRSNLGQSLNSSTVSSLLHILLHSVTELSHLQDSKYFLSKSILFLFFALGLLFFLGVFQKYIQKI